jgi:hypothetical protein
MSDEHNDQKLIIENFNKWVNENDIDQPLEEEELDEILGITAAGVTALGAKFVTTLYNVMKAYNSLTRVTDEIMASPDAPKELKNAARGAAAAGSDIGSGAGPIADELPLGQKLTQKAINMLVKRHLGIDIDVGQLNIPKIGSQQPEPEPSPDSPEPSPEPEDTEARTKLGLMSKDKEDRLKQLRDKYRK